MELEVVKTDGTPSGAKIKLPKHVFGIEPNEHAVYLAVKAQNANSRQGTAASKTRSMVSGGGRKPWKQKGRGAARAGTTRSPLWVGGGRVFGPQTRDYSQRLSRKVKALARASVFSDKAAQKKITIVEDFQVSDARTREVFKILKSLGMDSGKTLLLVSEHDAALVRAGRNLPKLQIRVAVSESTYDLLDCENLVIQKSAVEKIGGAFKK